MNPDLEDHMTARRTESDEAATPESNGSRPTGVLHGLIAALRLLLPIGRVGSSLPLRAYAAAPHWLILIGLLIGMAWAGLFRVTWRVYGETGSLRPVPVLAVILLECCFTGAFFILGFTRAFQSLTGPRPVTQGVDKNAPFTQHATLALCLLILVQFTLILSIPNETPWWPSSDWRARFNFLYPAPIYRPLILAPLWGRWGMLVAACVGRSARTADPDIAAFASAVRPIHLLAHAVLPLVLSAIYCAREGNFLVGIKLGLLVFGVTYLASVGMARRGGGQTRYSIYAAAQIAQLAALAIHRAFWAEIHG